MCVGMLSNEHEVLAELFRHQPPLAAELVAGLGAHVPQFADAKLEPNDYSDVMPTEWRSDGVVALTDDTGTREMAIVVEVQRGWPTEKRWVWPVYVTAARARLKCPVMLLVVCPDRGIAKQCANPIATGHPGFALTPLVLGPDRVPIVTDPRLSRRLPELAVLSALAHRDRPDAASILEALVPGLKQIDDRDHAALYTGVVFDALPEALQQHMEVLMGIETYEFKSNFMRRLKAEGRVDALLAFLAARAIDVPDDARERITSCTDTNELDEWIRRAAVATSVDDLFAV